MLTLTGKLLDVIPGGTSQKTGQIFDPTIEILHKVRGKSEVEKIKIDPKTEAAWTKAINQIVSVAVNPYAMGPDKNTPINKGLSLDDKAVLPTVQTATPRPVPAAA